MGPRLTAALVTLAALSVAVLAAAGCGGSSSDQPTLDGTARRLSGWSLIFAAEQP